MRRKSLIVNVRFTNRCFYKSKKKLLMHKKRVDSKAYNVILKMEKDEDKKMLNAIKRSIKKL